MKKRGPHLTAIALRVRTCVIAGADLWDLLQLVELARGDQRGGEILAATVNLGARLARETDQDAERLARAWEQSAREVSA